MATVRRTSTSRRKSSSKKLDQSNIAYSESIPESTKARFTFKPIVIILGVVGAILLWGLSVGWKKFHPLQNSLMQSEHDLHQEAGQSEADFFTEMIPHHQEAVDSSRYMVTNTTDPEIRTFAQGIVDNQTKEIWTMMGYYQTWYDKQFTGSSHYMQMMPDLSKYEGNDLNRIYLEHMIDHHQAAVDMSKNVLRVSKKEEVQTMANTIIEQQTEEIEKLKKWLEKYAVAQ
jgi:uncharacterized protein (DUF305 family)